MTSEIRSHIEYLIPTDNILVLLRLNLIKNLALLTVFNSIIQKCLTLH